MISIRRALFLVCLLLILGPLVLFWLWPHARMVEHENAEARQYHLLIARTVARTLERYHQDVAGAFNYVVGTLVEGGRAKADNRLLRSLNIRYVARLDSSTGAPLDVVAGTEPGPAKAIEPKLLARLVALASDGNTATGGVVTDGDAQPVFHLVRSAGQNLIVATLDTTYIADLARSIRFGETGHMAIVDGDGRALAHPDPAWERSARDLSGIAPVKRMLAGEAGVAEFRAAGAAADMIAGYAPVRGAGWGVMVTQPVAELRQAADIVRQRVFAIFTCGLLLAALIAIRAGIMITAPLDRLTAGARRMAEGDLDVRVDLGGQATPHEVVVLTRAFNNMAGRLAELDRRSTELRERAEKANSSKTEFVRIVTHELRSPVNAILGFSELLSGRGAARLTPEARDGYLRDINAGARHLLSLVNDLLDLARMECGQFELVEVEFWVDEIAHRARRYVEAQAGERGTEITVSFDGEPPLIHGDERVLFQVLLNLLSNAVRYGYRGGKVTIGTTTTPAGGVEILVADDGPGIAPDDLERVMLPFQRAQSKASTAIDGTGLGLPIVKRFVELHGGTFTLSSTLGQGTRARIALPASRVRSAPFEAPRHRPASHDADPVARAA